MSHLEFNSAKLNHLTALLLVLLLLGQSLVVWARLLWASQSGQRWLNRTDEPRATWTRFPEFTALGLVMLMLTLSVTNKYLIKPTADTKALTTDDLLSIFAFTGGVAVVLAAILLTSHRPPAEYGLKTRGLLAQVLDGVNGFSLALLPTAALLLLTAPLRNRDNQNSLLTLLSDSPDPATVAMICITAVIMAPLSEEMMFRVILQGALTSLSQPRIAIPLTAVAFAAIHGLIDGIALLPLAGVLGYVFDRRHSYVSVLVIHGLFNATMLTLALLTQA